MEFNTKQELFDYLDSFDFDSIRDTKLSSVYFLVEFDDHIEPIYFTRFEDVWFASPCILRKYPLKDHRLKEFIKSLYHSNHWEDGYEYEKTMQKNGLHYSISCPLCDPFLPDNIKIQDAFSDSKCLDWLLDHKNNTQVTENKNNI